MAITETRQDLGISRDWVLKLLNDAGIVTTISGAGGAIGTDFALANLRAVMKVSSKVTATGMNPQILKLTTDYTVAANKITWVTVQTGNTITVTYSLV